MLKYRTVNSFEEENCNLFPYFITAELQNDCYNGCLLQVQWKRDIQRSKAHCMKLTINGNFAISCNYHGNIATQPIKIKNSMEDTIDRW